MFDTLRQSSLFFNFTDKELKTISTFLKRRTFVVGEYLMREGSGAQSLFIIENGQVNILKQCLNGSDSHIAELHTDSIIGEVAFFDSYNRRSANVIAKTDVTALELSFASLEKISAENSKLGLRIYRVIASSLIDKLKETTVNVSEHLASSRFIALGDLVTSIAHEINNPLATIRLLCDKIAIQASPYMPDQESVQKILDDITRCFGHINKVMEEVRLASRGVQNDRLEFFSVKEVIENSLVLCQGKLKTLDINIEVSMLPNDFQIRCRPTQISQVLLNLISNAHDAVENLQKKWIRIEAKQTEDSCQISVTDSGNGIPMEIQERMFSPFYSTKGLGKGTGIGLSISKRIIESYQGKFFLDRDNPNTRFVIQLPRSVEVKNAC